LAYTWHLTISTWAGVSIGAAHYYGRIHQPDTRRSKTYPMSPDEERLYGDVEVEHALTADEARALTAKDDYHWEAGTPTRRFDTKEHVMATAIAQWREIARKRGGGVLRLGNPAYLDENAPVIAEEPGRPVAR
jgi:hypothetical protein